MNKEMDDNLDLLDLEDDAELSSLPETSPFASPRPKRPWLLIGVGLLIIFLATYIIIRTIGTDSSSSIEVDLGTPEVVTIDPGAGQEPDSVIIVPPQSDKTPPPAAVAPRPDSTHATPGVPMREVTDRKEVTFDPNKTASKPAAKPAPKPAAAKPKPAAKPKAAQSGGWYVQFGSYSTRALAESAQKKIKAQHSSLFDGKQFVILAAVLPNGTTTYRLRIAFPNSAEANGFCRNAKSDGLDCYVAK